MQALGLHNFYSISVSSDTLSFPPLDTLVWLTNLLHWDCVLVKISIHHPPTPPAHHKGQGKAFSRQVSIANIIVL